MHLTARILLTCFIAIAVSGCAPKVGSEAWCERLDEKPKGEWTLEEVGDYAKHCVIRTDDEG